MKKMSEHKKLAVVLIIALGIGALMYSYFALVGVNETTRLYILMGMATMFVFYLGSSIYKLKKDSVLYDEREGYIEKETNAISHDVFRVVLLLLGLLTYTTDEITINVSGLIFLLFGIMWITDMIVHFIIKRKN